MKIKIDLKTEHSDFTIERNDRKFEVDLKNFKKEFNTDVKCYKTIKKEPLEVNTYENSISINNTNGSNVWNNSCYNSETDCKKEEIKEENYNTKYIKSECKVVLKRLNFKVKTEDCKQVYLPVQYVDSKAFKNESFIPDRNFNRNDTNVRIKEEEESKEYDIQHNSKAQKQNKCNRKKTKFVLSIRKYNKIQRDIKRKYLRVTRSSHCKQNHKCDLCKQTFVNKEILQAHLNFHIGKKPFCCTTCNQKFSWQFLLRRHRKEHNSEKQSEIDHCKLRLPSSSSNERKVSKSKHFRCDICDKLLISKGNLERHNKTHHQVSHCCKICKKNFQTKSKLRKHQRTHSVDRPFKCDVCEKGFRTNGQLKSHRKTHSDQYKYSCQVCNKSFKTKRSLTVHKMIHNKDLNHSCQICNKYFKTERYLRKHARTHEDKRDKYFCDICKTGFTCKSSVDRHRIAQHQNMFVCCYCSRSFETKNMLKTHQKIHIQKCNICKKELASKYALNVHQRIHFDIKPFVCEVCNRRFISSFRLKRHQSFHNKDNLRFVCEVCKKRFYDKSHLIQHQPVHHKKHLCLHCKSRFRTKAKLKLHIQFCAEIHSQQLA
ncbi:zinc finger protein 62-like [Centruroides sculpturatus]|uniref:zinc finger protein 62-like n=1 Tax=Centruroides sculpturatus TaxID=218467 RepID=UPI000C6DDBB5|nr:zinc finger protein 62-like [Centruroides sculpturatus]